MGRVNVTVALALLGLCLLGTPIAEVALVAAFFMVIRVIASAQVNDYFFLCTLFLISDGVRNFGYNVERQSIEDLGSNWQPITKLLWIDSMRNFVGLGAIQVTLPLVAGLSLIFFFISKFSFKRTFDVLLLVILIVCFLSSYYGYVKGNNGYSTSVYILFALLAVHWGTYLRIPHFGSWVPTFFSCVYFGLLGCAIGIIQGHLIFLIVGISGAMICYYFLHRKYFRCFITICCSFFIAINATYTLFGSLILSLTLGLLVSNKTPTLLAIRLLYLSFLGLMGLLLYVAIRFDRLVYAVNSEFVARAFDKFALDRAPVWKGAYEMIVNTDELISPSSRSYDIIYGGVLRQWDVGAHNVLLEVFRQIGWFGGVMISVSILYFLYQLFVFLSRPNMVKEKLICISLISIFFTYGFTGHYLITGGVGIIYGALGGMIMQLRHYSSHPGRKASNGVRSTMKLVITDGKNI
jgi:hypothetical protein